MSCINTYCKYMVLNVLCYIDLRLRDIVYVVLTTTIVRFLVHSVLSCQGLVRELSNKGPFLTSPDPLD